MSKSNLKTYIECYNMCKHLFEKHPNDKFFKQALIDSTNDLINYITSDTFLKQINNLNL